MILVDEREKTLRLGLSGIASTRNSLARIIRAYYRDNIDSTRFRNLLTGFNTYINALKVESELIDFKDLVERVSLLEEK